MKYKFLILNLIGLLYIQDLNASTSGNCGPRSGLGTNEDPYVYNSNCTYEYDADTKTLTISGEGQMSGFSYVGDVEQSDAPWRGLGYENVIISEGITSIGNFAFRNSSVKSVTLPESLTDIGVYAFNGTDLAQVNLPNKPINIYDGAFAATKLSSITLPEGLVNMPHRMLESTEITELVIPASVTNISETVFAYSTVTRPIIQKIYCSTIQMAQCEAAVAYRGEDIEIEEYQTDGNTYFYNNHWYTSPSDIIGDSHIKKRIYTIDEANRVAGQKNRVSIKYR